ncbi:spore coat protein [Priestia megaterium]
MVQEILDQLFEISTNITSIWIKDSYRVKVKLTETQTATSLHLSLQLLISFVINTISDDINVNNYSRGHSESKRSNIEQINNQEIIIDNSKDVTILITDTEFILSIEILLQILLVLLVQLDVL